MKSNNRYVNPNYEDTEYYNNANYSQEYSDGTYCSTVEYYNPNTGTRNTYTLNVEVENEELVKINFKSGWLDDSNFTPEDIPSGECTITTDRNYEYEVTLNEYGECSFSDEDDLEKDISNDEQSMKCNICGSKKDYKYDDYCYTCKTERETCPKCYGYKFEYEKICSSCVDEIEHTCPNCGGRKFFSTDDYCDNCKGDNY